MSAPKLSDEELQEIATRLTATYIHGGKSVERGVQQITRLLAEHADLRARTTWRPISEAPRETWVLLGTKYGTPVVAVRWDRYECWTDEDGDECKGFTHFMPLPEPPP